MREIQFADYLRQELRKMLPGLLKEFNVWDDNAYAKVKRFEENRKLYQQAYYEAHKEEKRAYQRRYNKLHYKEIAEYQREYRKRAKERQLASTAKELQPGNKETPVPSKRAPRKPVSKARPASLQLKIRNFFRRTEDEAQS